MISMQFSHFFIRLGCITQLAWLFSVFLGAQSAKVLLKRRETDVICLLIHRQLSVYLKVFYIGPAVYLPKKMIQLRLCSGCLLVAGHNCSCLNCYALSFECISTSPHTITINFLYALFVLVFPKYMVISSKSVWKFQLGSHFSSL